MCKPTLCLRLHTDMANHWTNYSRGGKEQALEAKAKEGLSGASAKAEGLIDQGVAKAKEGAAIAESKAKELGSEVKTQAEKLTR